MSTAIAKIALVLDYADDSINAVEDAAAALADARALVMELEDQRAGEKTAAVQRLMGTENPETNKPHSASSAEKIVELDALYAEFRARQRAAVVAEQRAWGEYEAAKLRAQLRVAAIDHNITLEHAKHRTSETFAGV